MDSRFNPAEVMGSAVLPPFMTSTYVFPSAEAMEHAFKILLGRVKLKRGEKPPFIYGRFGSPNSVELEQQLVGLEKNSAYSLVFPSGMSAITTMILSHVKPGQVILYTNPVYGCTNEFFHSMCARLGIKAIPFSRMSRFKRCLRTYKGRVGMVYIETPANPSLRLWSLREISELTRKAQMRGQRILVAVDNTFMGPVFQKPFLFDVDFVIYSMTKFLGGHSDIIGGAVLTRTLEMIAPIKQARDVLGPTIHPIACWLVSRSLPELSLRMNQQASNAGTIARFLAEHPKVESVIYPGWNDNGSQAKIFADQCYGGGSMVTFYIKGGKKAAFRFINALRVFFKAVSLGSVESLAEHPLTTTHAAVPHKLLEIGGVTSSMVRLSAGIEPIGKLLSDLDQALEKA